MSSHSTFVADNMLRADCQRPPVPGCGDILGNYLSTTSKSSVISEVSAANTPLSTSLIVTSTTPCKPSLHQEPDGCTSSMAFCPDISEPGLSKMDSLVSLLNDRHGVTCFRQFLSAKRACDILEFWLACVGYQKIDAIKRSSLALVIYKTFVVSAGSRIRLAGSTRRAIKEKLKSGHVDNTIFDSAVAEVQTLLLRDYYPSFLESHEYAEYIQTRSANQSPSSDGSSGHSTNCSQLLTANRDDCQHYKEDKPCKVHCSNSNAVENRKTCSDMSPSHQHTGDCLAQTGYVMYLTCWLSFLFTIVCYWIHLCEPLTLLQCLC